MKKEEMVEARICVKVRAEDKLPDSALALVGKEIVQISVSYDWCPTVCSLCRTFRHSDSV